MSGVTLNASKINAMIAFAFIKTQIRVFILD